MHPGDHRQTLIRRFRDVRRQTVALCAPLAVDDHMLQAVEETSPPKWHLGHTTWFFETFVLGPEEREFRPHHPRFGYLFNSYYEAVGPRQPRPERGLLSRPTLDEVHGYRHAVEARVLALLESCDHDALARIEPVLALGCEHEQQHQELLLTDLKYSLSRNVLRPGRTGEPPRAGGDPGEGSWIGFEGGLVAIGARGEGFAFDNERPRHRVFLEPYRLRNRLVTNGEYLGFVEDGGYRRPELWLADGWAWVQDRGVEAPLYWERTEGWQQYTLGGMRPLDPEEPVCHVAFYEADAFARWAGARLPTEAEWEHAFEDVPIPADANVLETGRHHPRPLTRPADGLQQGFGDVWEWTASPYVAYPGYRPPEGAIGEYNGKFMCNQMVLRGGSCATPRSQIRTSCRNFFPPQQRWQFMGLRLARDAT